MESYSSLYAVQSSPVSSRCAFAPCLQAKKSLLLLTNCLLIPFSVLSSQTLWISNYTCLIYISFLHLHVQTGFNHLPLLLSLQQAFTGIPYRSDLLLGAEETEVMEET